MTKFESATSMNRPRTVVFYSFRGGVGRTTFLLSVAEVLARDFNSYRFTKDFAPEPIAKGKIGIIDFDLEAPGIDAFPTMAPESEAQLGLVEYIEYYLENQSAGELPDFVYTPPGNRSTVVMRAGRDDQHYLRALSRLDFNHLYRFEHGEALIENMRAGFSQEFECETLLVDSRTGFSDIGGVCLGHLADAVVVVFQPTRAYFKRLPAVIRSIQGREAAQGIRVPRMYICSKTPESQYDGILNEDSKKLALELVQRCEPGIEVHSLNENELHGTNTEILADSEQICLGFVPIYTKPTVGMSLIDPEVFIAGQDEIGEGFFAFPTVYEDCAYFIKSHRTRKTRESR